VIVMPLDDALALAEQLLADYDASGLGEVPGPDLLWSDQLAQVLRDLTAAASAWHVTPLATAWPPSSRPPDTPEARPGEVAARAGPRLRWPGSCGRGRPG
jgi:hypothetical protein